MDPKTFRTPDQTLCGRFRLTLGGIALGFSLPSRPSPTIGESRPSRPSLSRRRDHPSGPRRPNSRSTSRAWVSEYARLPPVAISRETLRVGELGSSQRLVISS